MRPRLPLTINWKFAVDFFSRGLHTRTAVARLPLRQLGLFVHNVLLLCIVISKVVLVLYCFWKGSLMGREEETDAEEHG